MSKIIVILVLQIIIALPDSVSAGFGASARSELQASTNHHRADDTSLHYTHSVQHSSSRHSSDSLVDFRHVYQNIDTEDSYSPFTFEEMGDHDSVGHPFSVGHFDDISASTRMPVHSVDSIATSIFRIQKMLDERAAVLKHIQELLSRREVNIAMARIVAVTRTPPERHGLANIELSVVFWDEFMKAGFFLDPPASGGDKALITSLKNAQYVRMNTRSVIRLRDCIASMSITQHVSTHGSLGIPTAQCVEASCSKADPPANV
ncbi:hypothetical protein SeMB42_g05437 [Synchytrium endobioticum]|uniref:Uncharacterized protein n=1 Tax=Synchytrium endobioticum TaxID=286115 RepID=A0A507CRG8_9FUNG|nr:hypothetical protein SeMB42_g05437 [Synchytrium endobioticum]TPX44339.1 hypothetical protein SeLEV6574_g04547 [Synchytrium endobioticum]